MNSKALTMVAAVVLPLVLGAGNATPPDPQMPPRIESEFTVTGMGLTIEIGETTTYLKFRGPVTVSRPGLVLKAQVVELDVLSGEVTGGQKFEAPKLPNQTERVMQDPGKAAADMARELKLPEARFSEDALKSALKRVSASGGVSVTVSAPKALTIQTPQMLSLDGGRSWTASGGCKLAGVDPKTHEQFGIQADALVYDTENQRAVGRGNIRGRFVRGGEPPVEIEAAKCDVDLGKSTLSITEPLTVYYETMVLKCGSLKADLRNRTLKAGGQPRVESGDPKMAMAAATLNVDLDKQIVIATGGVQVEDKGEYAIKLTADRLWADLLNKVMVATGNPVVRKGKSEFKGEKIKVSQVEGRTVVEVDGEQRARLNEADLDQAKLK